jgi:protein-tyrosine-phosphatase
VLFVCTGNTCRSPGAELLARAAGVEGLEFGSAGTHATDGDPMSPELVAALPVGLDTASFRSRRLTAGLLEEADLVLTMEAAQRTWILDRHPALSGKVCTLGQLAEALETVPTGPAREATRRDADPALDVPDPYRRGAEAASGCVARLQELLAAVLPALCR